MPVFTHRCLYRPPARPTSRRSFHRLQRTVLVQPHPDDSERAVGRGLPSHRQFVMSFLARPFGLARERERDRGQVQLLQGRDSGSQQGGMFRRVGGLATVARLLSRFLGHGLPLQALVGVGHEAQFPARLCPRRDGRTGCLPDFFKDGRDQFVALAVFLGQPGGLLRGHDAARADSLSVSMIFHRQYKVD